MAECLLLLPLGALALLAHGLILAPVWFPLQALTGLIWAGAVPGVLTIQLLLAEDRELDFVERALLAVGVGYASLVLGTLALHFLPGPLTRTHLLLFYDALILVLLGLFVRRREGMALQHRLLGPVQKSAPAPALQAGALLILLLVAALFRLPNLGYSEFQGDEARAMLRAAEVLQGNDEVLFLHKKGPVEILLPALLYGLSGRINEWVARLPFALAGLSAVAALYLLGRRLLGPRAAWLAAMLAAIDGYFVAFSRIVQYQSVVLLTTGLALFCTHRFYQREDDRPVYLLLGALFAAVGLLAHYEGFFALPGMAYLLWAKARRQGQGWGQPLRWAAPPLLLGAILAGGFYLPFLLHPHFRQTAIYLGEKRVGGSLLYNNLADFFLRSTFYNASYYILLLILALVTGLILQLRRAYPRPHWLAPLLALAGLAAIVLWPQAWQAGRTSLSLVVFILIAGALLLARRVSDERRLLILWFSAPALLYFFLILKVHTHYYVAFPAWLLIAGSALDQAIAALQVGAGLRAAPARRWILPACVTGGVAWYLICGYYIYWAFIQHDPEYYRTYPQHRLALYWMPCGDRLPRGGYFGFPYRTAWKAVGGLYAAGILQGTYSSNQEDLVTNWYTRGALRCPEPDLFIVARDVHEPHEIIPGVVDGHYMPAARVLRDGKPQLWIYRRGAETSVVDYPYAQYAAHFDRELSAPIFRVGAPLDEVFAPSHPVEARLGDHFLLAGWDLDRKVVPPGGQVLLTLYWRTLEHTPADYHVFVHVGQRAKVAQRDSVPRCGRHPTYRWRRGEEVVDRYLLTIAPDAPEGGHPIWVGMYDMADGERLPISDAQGQPLGTSLLLAHLRVGEPKFEVPPIPHPQEATLGGRVRLLGYKLPSAEAHPSGSIRLTLYWQCLEEMERSYTVFVHLLDGEGRMRGQRDGLPWDGRLPTDLWVPGEVIVDSYQVPVAPEAAPGSYTLEIGMYDARTGERLPAVGPGGERLPGDRIVISRRVQVR